MKRFVAVLLLVTAALAQDERDPFAPGDRLKDPNRTGFVPKDAPGALPSLILRGLVQDRAGRRLALLEVDGRATYLVRKDDAIDLRREVADLVLRVVEITDLDVRVEVGELQRVVVVR